MKTLTKTIEAIASNVSRHAAVYAAVRPNYPALAPYNRSYAPPPLTGLRRSYLTGLRRSYRGPRPHRHGRDRSRVQREPGTRDAPGRVQRPAGNTAQSGLRTAPETQPSQSCPARRPAGARWASRERPSSPTSRTERPRRACLFAKARAPRGTGGESPARSAAIHLARPSRAPRRWEHVPACPRTSAPARRTRLREPPPCRGTRAPHPSPRGEPQRPSRRWPARFRSNGAGARPSSSLRLGGASSASVSSRGHVPFSLK